MRAFSVHNLPRLRGPAFRHMARVPRLSSTVHTPGLPLTGPEWAARVRAGDVDAFEAAFRAISPGLTVFLLRYVYAREQAEDIVQDLFLAIWRQRATLDVRESVATFLYAAARNRAISALRHARVVERARQGDLSDTLSIVPAVEEVLRDAELTEALSRAVEALPARCQEIFRLNREGGRTYVAIAEELGVSIKTVETQMGRALRAIRARLLPYLK